jgi:predicted aldo/keto reductase-like oxidoreductase
MEKRFFKSIAKEISLLGFGLMRLPLLHPQKPDIDQEQAQAMVDRALAAGVNYFDTAYVYHAGLSESFAGQALSRHPRDSYNLATKLPTWEITSPAAAESIFHEQLKKCRVEYFDFYLLHNLNADHYRLVREHGIYEIMLRKKQQGFIRRLGFSFHDHTSLLQQIADDYDWDFGQIQLNYIDWEDLNSRRQYKILRERNLPVVVMEPVRGGALATLPPQAAALLQAVDHEASLASWAIRYAASLPGVLTVLSGMSNLAQMEDNLQTMNNFRPISEDELDLLSAVATVYRSAGVIPCTACRYCLDCPMGVNIPRVFAVYNLYRTLPTKDQALAARLFSNHYRALTISEQAHNCVACGQCGPRCPQGIDIPEQMRMIAALAQRAANG